MFVAPSFQITICLLVAREFINCQVDTCNLPYNSVEYKHSNFKSPPNSLVGSNAISPAVSARCAVARKLHDFTQAERFFQDDDATAFVAHVEVKY